MPYSDTAVKTDLFGSREIKSCFDRRLKAVPCEPSPKTTMSWNELCWLQKLAWKVNSTHAQDLRRYLNFAINDGKASSAYPSHSEIRT